MRSQATQALTLLALMNATPSLAASFDCALAEERLRYLAKDAEKDGQDYFDMKKRLDEMSLRSLNERQAQQFASLKQDAQYVRKMVRARQAELGREMSRVRGAACAELAALEIVEAQAEAAAQKILKDHSP